MSCQSRRADWQSERLRIAHTSQHWSSPITRWPHNSVQHRCVLAIRASKKHIPKGTVTYIYIRTSPACRPDRWSHRAANTASADRCSGRHGSRATGSVSPSRRTAATRAPHLGADCSAPVCAYCPWCELPRTNDDVWRWCVVVGTQKKHPSAKTRTRSMYIMQSGTLLWFRYVRLYRNCWSRWTIHVCIYKCGSVAIATENENVRYTLPLLVT